MSKVEVTCARCGSVRLLYPSQAATRKYCSKDCAWAVQRENAGPHTKPCAECGAPIVEDFASSLAERTYCSRTCHNRSRERVVVAPCEVCGAEMRMIPAVAGRKVTCSRSCNGVRNIRRRQQRFPRNQSKRGDAAIVEFIRCWDGEALDFVTELKVDQFYIDLAVPSLGIAIELDGAYWHGRPEQRARDRRKNQHLLDRGWQILRITMPGNESAETTAMRIDASLKWRLMSERSAS